MKVDLRIIAEKLQKRRNVAIKQETWSTITYRH